MKTLLILAMILAGVVSAQAQIIFSMQIIADNDYAVFSGTADSVDTLIYQNNYSWPDQLSNLSTLTFSLPQGDTTFYLLGMGGGGEENIAGTVNGVDITSISPVNVSSDLGPYLNDYENQNQGAGTVADGTYNASLADVQTAFPSLTWSNAASDINTSEYVITQSPNGIGYAFPTGNAVLFQFNASSVGVTAAPEPSSLGLLGLGLTALFAMFSRKKSALILSQS